jgi:hypothetical protein
MEADAFSALQRKAEAEAEMVTRKEENTKAQAQVGGGRKVYISEH